jgi:DNA-binding SARP family transcriptional activator
MSCTIANASLEAPRANACSNIEAWLAIGKQFVPDFARRPFSLPPGITESPARTALDALHAGDFTRALEYAQEALDVADLVGVPAAQLVTRCLYGRALMEQGELDRAASVLDGALASAKQARDRRLIRLASLLSAECELRCGRGSSALARLRGGLGRTPPFHPVETELVVSQSLANLCVQALDADVEVFELRELIKQLHLQPDPPPLHVVNWPWAVHVKTLGAAEVRAGRDVLPGGKLTELLFFLAAHADVVVAREAVAAALWPESDGDQANNALKTTLHRVRRALDDHDRVRVVDGQLTLDPTTCWTDVAALRDLMDRIARLFAKRAPVPSMEIAASLADRLLMLYRGRFLDGRAEAWTVSIREQLHQRFLTAVGTLGKHLEAHAAWNDAIEIYERALLVDACCEPLYRGVMRAHEQLGCATEVVRVYERCRRVLRASMNLDPSEETRAIRARVRHTAGGPLER